jgi:hypothetical protein
MTDPVLGLGLEGDVRRHWRPLLVVLVLAAIANLVLAPDWNALQTARDATTFVRMLDHPARILGAATCDLVFAASYGILGYVGLRRWGERSRLARVAAVAVLIGAASDELENVLLIRNVVRRADLSDAWIDVMRLAGTVKWVAAPAVLLLYGYLVRAALRHRRRIRR